MSIEKKVAKMFDNPRDRDIFMYNPREVERNFGIKIAQKTQLVKDITELIDNPKGSAYVQLMKWRKLGGQMFKLIELWSSIVDDAFEIVRRTSDLTETNKGKKWTEQDDELLIECVCADKYSSIEIASIMGRSVPAIKTRISQLVGISRISEEIAGKFVGTIDGAHIQGNIKGTLSK